MIASNPSTFLITLKSFDGICVSFLTRDKFTGPNSILRRITTGVLS